MTTESAPELGDLLVLMAGAHRSFRTLRAELRLWRDHERSHAAHMRQHEQHSGSSGMIAISYSIGSEEESEPGPSEAGERIRLWLARPDRLRQEASLVAGNRHVESVLVQAGDTWWSFDPLNGAHSNGGDPTYSHGASIDRTVLDPAHLLSACTFEILGRTTHAGRDAIRVRSSPSPRDPVLPEGGYPGFWPQELLVDAERGVLLRSTSLFEGEPFSITEFVDVAFDEEMPDDLFVFVPPQGEEVRDARAELAAHHRAVPLHEAALLVPFTVYAPASVPGEWQMQAHVHSADERRGRQASVNIFYSDRMGRVNVNIVEQAAGETGLPRTSPDGGEWSVEHIESGELWLWDPPGARLGMPRVALLDIDGTRVQIMSADLSLEAIAELAVNLVPAPSEPPSLG
jgi:hypothetical protein